MCTGDNSNRQLVKEYEGWLVKFNKPLRQFTDEDYSLIVETAVENVNSAKENSFLIKCLDTYFIGQINRKDNTISIRNP